jgi:hypothetical protein
MSDDIRLAGEDRKMTGALMLDFEDAFNCLLHPLIIHKLKEVGVDGHLLEWFRSYFTNRMALVRHGDKSTDFMQISKGCPQGSSLSGLIYIIYVNDLEKELNCNSISYADDATLYAHGTIIEIQAILQHNLKKVISWASQVGMKINSMKTKCITFTPPKLKSNDKLVILVVNNIIEQVEEFKLLGIVFDSSLTFTTHFNTICKEMTSRMYLINRYKRFFSQKWTRIFCTSLVLSKLDYALPVWGNLCKSMYQRVDKIMFRLSSLVILQKSCKKSEMFNVFEKLDWLTIAERYELYSLKFMFRNIINVSTLTQCFPDFKKNVNSTRETRSSQDFKQPSFKIEFAKKSFVYQFSKLWNALPTNIKTSKNMNEFDSAIRNLLVKKRNDIFMYANQRIIH